MESLLQILIVDDHPTMVEGYKSVLLSNPTHRVELVSAYSCKEAFELITKTNKPFDIVLLDLILPAFESEKLYSGEDLSVLVRKKWPTTKIMILTSQTEGFDLYDLTKKTQIDGLLVKSDFDGVELFQAIDEILCGGIYYSKTIRQIIKEVAEKGNTLDAYNRRIISLLAKGVQTKNLPQHLNLSISSIDKRKAQIKDFFGIEKGGDEDIVIEAKKKGFV